jgi:hypothetical protein
MRLASLTTSANGRSAPGAAGAAGGAAPGRGDDAGGTAASAAEAGTAGAAAAVSAVEDCDAGNVVHAARISGASVAPMRGKTNDCGMVQGRQCGASTRRTESVVDERPWSPEASAWFGQPLSESA